jgi:transposase
LGVFVSAMAENERENEVFAETLGLTEPWYVERVVFDHKKLQVDVYLAYRTRGFPCPVCGEPSPIHDTKTRRWKHLYFFQYPTYIHAKIPRVNCQEHGTRLTKIPWSRPKSRFSDAFEMFLVMLCTEMSVSAAAAMAGIHPNSAWRVLHHHVEQARKKQDLTYLRKVGVDEAAVKKGHNYVTVFCDIERSRVVDVETGRDSSTITRFKNWVKDKGKTSPKLNPRQIEQFCCDMSPAYIKGIDTNFPDAEVTYDRYHVLTIVNRALDTVRRRERTTNQAKKNLLRNTRYLWLKNPSNLTQKQTSWLTDIKKLDLKTARAYHLKTALQRLWEHTDPAQAERYLKKWYFWATHSRLEPMVQAAKTIKRHWDGVLQFIQSHISNGVIEGLINKIKTAMKRAYGFKKPKYLKTIIYLVASDLDLPTPKNFAKLQPPTQS